MTGTLTPFPADPGEPRIGPPAGWTVLHGNPVARAWRHYTSADGGLFAGTWECTPGSFAVVYDKWEFCEVLSGRCRITPRGGAPVMLEAGAAFVLEPGFSGTWDVLETMRKHFVFRT